MASSLRKRIEELLQEHAPLLQKAFLEGVKDLRSNANLRLIVAALERNDIDGAIKSLNLDPAAFRAFDRALTAAFDSGGIAATAYISSQAVRSGIAAVFRFNARDPRAESWLLDHSSTMITRILDDQRVMVRNILSAGLREGSNPRTIALSLTGRINRATGVREGGAIGLTSMQEKYARTALAELTSGDPALMRNYLTRGRRDKRSDRAVLAAIRNGEGLSLTDAEAIVGRYRSGLLNLRGETIARLEAKAALHQSEHESFLQAVGTGQVNQSDVQRTWRHVGNLHPREQHISMDGQTVGLEEPFTAPDGTKLMYPCDPDAPVSHTANCHCQVDTTIDFIGALAREEAA
ncbi:head morphogenesis protein [Hyphomicrobium sp. DY-1]|uniref:head morphogenesis protein n=1 Tax=Hyphomicrobium sp. DY-1 TaxID=3075650 RepID=UPI0039C12D14